MSLIERGCERYRLDHALTNRTVPSAQKHVFLGKTAELPSALWAQMFVDVRVREVFGQHWIGRKLRTSKRQFHYSGQPNGGKLEATQTIERRRPPVLKIAKDLSAQVPSTKEERPTLVTEPLAGLDLRIMRTQGGLAAF